MSNLNDGCDEIIVPRLPLDKRKLPNIEEIYRNELHQIRLMFKSRIDLYTSFEFKELKDWLKKNVDEDEANRIMDNNLF